MASIYEMREEALRISNQAKAKLLEITASTDATRASEIEAEFDRMVADADKLEERADMLEKLEAREKAYNEADSRRPTEDRASKALNAEERDAAAFGGFIRSGMHSLNAEQRALVEMRAQSVGTNSEGGYLAPNQFRAEMQNALKALGPMFDGSVVTILETDDGNHIDMPSLDNTAAKATKIGENTQVSTRNLTFGVKSLDAYTYTTDAVLVSNQLLRNAAVNVEAIIRTAMSEMFYRGIGEALTVGDGVGDPNGLVTAATSGKTAAAAAAVAADELFDLEASLDPAYRRNASFMFNDATRTALRKLKNSNNDYVWQPGLSVGDPQTILGYRFHVNPDMASIAASAKSVLFGDFSKYTVRVVRDLRIQRLVERYADYNQVGFIGFMSADGELMDSRAVRALTQAAS